jgi:hypothetical protein
VEGTNVSSATAVGSSAELKPTEHAAKREFFASWFTRSEKVRCDCCVMANRAYVRHGVRT